MKFQQLRRLLTRLLSDHLVNDRGLVLTDGQALQGEQITQTNRTVYLCVCVSVRGGAGRGSAQLHEHITGVKTNVTLDMKASEAEF